MEQYAKTLVSSLTSIMDKKKIDKVFTKKLKKFITVYFQMMDTIGIKDYSVYNEKINSERLTKLAYSTALKQADSKRFATKCKTEECMRVKMACNIIDNIMMLVPLNNILDNPKRMNKLSEVINYSNNEGTYRYLYNVTETMYGKATGSTPMPIVNPVTPRTKLEGLMKEYNNVKMELSKYY